MNLALLYTAENVTDQAGFENLFSVFLLRCLSAPTHAVPIVLRLDISNCSLLVVLGYIDVLEFFVHLVEQIAKEIASILLLIVRVIVEEEGFEDVFRVDDSIGERITWVYLITLVKVLADVYKFAK